MVALVESVGRTFAEELLETERREHAATVRRLDEVIRQQAEELALLKRGRDELARIIRRQEADLVEARTKARAMQLIEQWRDGELGEAMADVVTLKLEDYADDGSGRQMFAPVHELIQGGPLVDGEWIPTRVFASKVAPGGGEPGRLKFEVDMSSLRYVVSVVDDRDPQQTH